MARVVNNGMYGKDRSDLGAMVSLKVQGNSTPAIESAVRKDLVNLRTYHMEYDICSKRARLPACFSRIFGMEVGPFVMLRDPNGNEVEVAVEKKNGKVYFAKGWEVLTKFYKISGGTWITIVYANRHLFLFELRNMHGEEFVYPQFTPPQRFFVENQRAHDYRNSFIRYGSNALQLPTNFCHVMVKELTEADVTSGMLRLNWLGFCQASFLPERCELTVVDYLGFTWKLLMDFCHDEGVSCIFSGQWPELCVARKLAKGTNIKLGVTGAANNRIVYLCAPPMLVLRTELPSSAGVGQGRHAYRVEEYFWKN